MSDQTTTNPESPTYGLETINMYDAVYGSNSGGVKMVRNWKRLPAIIEYLETRIVALEAEVEALKESGRHKSV